MKTNDIRFITACASVIGVAVVAAVAYVKKNKAHDEAEIEKLKIQATYPPEYWKTKGTEAKAKTEAKEAEIRSNERLVIDMRNREEQRIKDLREFEKDAPQEYWAQKEIEEKEKSRRHQMNLDDARFRARDRVDRDIARRNAQALETGARSLERAVSSIKTV